MVLTTACDRTQNLAPLRMTLGGVLAMRFITEPVTEKVTWAASDPLLNIQMVQGVPVSPIRSETPQAMPVSPILSEHVPDLQKNQRGSFAWLGHS